jgi:hypothetical protein
VAATGGAVNFLQSQHLIAETKITDDERIIPVFKIPGLRLSRRLR